MALGGLKGKRRPDQAVAIGSGLISGTISAHSRTTRFDQYLAQPPTVPGQFLGQSPPSSAETLIGPLSALNSGEVMTLIVCH